MSFKDHDEGMKGDTRKDFLFLSCNLGFLLTTDMEIKETVTELIHCSIPALVNQTHTLLFAVNSERNKTTWTPRIHMCKWTTGEDHFG